MNLDKIKSILNEGKFSLKDHIAQSRGFTIEAYGRYKDRNGDLYKWNQDRRRFDRYSKEEMEDVKKENKAYKLKEFINRTVFNRARNHQENG